MQGKVLEVPLLQELGEKYGRTPVQVVLRWNLQMGVATIPKSVRPNRIEDNARIFDFELEEGDVARICGLDRGQRFGPDPDNFEF
jgi:diketogulonate reductase-like aldo/keto reductase